MPDCALLFDIIKEFWGRWLFTFRCLLGWISNRLLKLGWKILNLIKFLWFILRRNLFVGSLIALLLLTTACNDNAQFITESDAVNPAPQEAPKKAPQKKQDDTSTNTTLPATDESEVNNLLSNNNINSEEGLVNILDFYGEYSLDTQAIKEFINNKNNEVELSAVNLSVLEMYPDKQVVGLELITDEADTYLKINDLDLNYDEATESYHGDYTNREGKKVSVLAIPDIDAEAKDAYKYILISEAIDKSTSMPFINNISVLSSKPLFNSNNNNNAENSDSNTDGESDNANNSLVVDFTTSDALVKFDEYKDIISEYFEEDELDQMSKRLFENSPGKNNNCKAWLSLKKVRGLGGRNSIRKRIRLRLEYTGYYLKFNGLSEIVYKLNGSSNDDKQNYYVDKIFNSSKLVNACALLDEDEAIITIVKSLDDNNKSSLAYINFIDRSNGVEKAAAIIFDENLELIWSSADF